MDLLDTCQGQHGGAANEVVVRNFKELNTE